MSKQPKIKNFLPIHNPHIIQPQSQNQPLLIANKPPNHTRKLGNTQFSQYLKSQPNLSSLIYNIQRYLEQHQHHQFYYQSLLSYWCGRDLQTLQVMIKKQYQLLLTQKSFLHKINNAIKSRYHCIQKIKRELNKVQRILKTFRKVYLDRKNQEQDNVYLEYTEQEGYTAVDIQQTILQSIQQIKVMFMDIRQLRGMTIYTIETIHRWRIQIEQWMDHCNRHSRIDFIIIPQLLLSSQLSSNPITAYQQIHNDTNFIFTSKLKQYIWFQHKSDPLIIRNVIQIQQKQQRQILQKYFIQFLYPKDNQNNLIDKCIQCLQMLEFNYKVKQVNLFEEQQKLIENYLSLEHRNNQQAGYYTKQQEQINMHQQFDCNQKQRYKVALKYQLYPDKKLSRVRVSNGLAIRNSQITRKEINDDYQQYYQKDIADVSPYVGKGLKKQSGRGWVFGKQLKKPNTNKIRELVMKHQVEMQYLKKHRKLVKPFNITNYSQKSSIALAYLNQKLQRQKVQNKKTQIYQPGLNQLRNDRNFQKRVNKNYMSENQQTYKSETLQISRNRMHQSLVKFQQQVIFEDPKQYDEGQTPKNRHKSSKKFTEFRKKTQRKTHNKSLQKIQSNKPFIDSPRKGQTHHKSKLNNTSKSQQHSDDNSQQNKLEKQPRKSTHHKIKINSIVQGQIDKIQKSEIHIEVEETPLNLKSFFSVFRADTEKKAFKRKQVLGKHKLEGSMAMSKLVDRRRAQSLKYLPVYKNIKTSRIIKHIKNKSNKKNQISKSLEKDKSNTSFQSYTKLQTSMVKSSIVNAPDQDNVPNNPLSLVPQEYINLTPKKITQDCIKLYVQHLISQLPVSTNSFTQYNRPEYSYKLLQTLRDPTLHTIIFELNAQKSGKIGQAIILQQLSRNLKLRYEIIFISVNKTFEMYVNAVARIAEEILSVTMCEEVVWKCRGDKKDYVSQHFFIIIDQQLKLRCRKFGIMNILQKKIPSYIDKDQFERIYLIQRAAKKSIQQQVFKKNIMNNYRSLVIQSKSLLLASNFKLRSQSLKKDVIHNYRQESIGQLYVAVLEKIMTKYHMKQLKIASMTLNDGDQMVNLVKNGPFLRSIFHTLLSHLKNKKQQEDQVSDSSVCSPQTISFTNMTDLLNYLDFRDYSQMFNFSFLKQSKFFLNHQLTLSEVSVSTSLQFIISHSGNLLVLNNFKKHLIKKYQRRNNNEEQTVGYLLPTLTSKLHLLLVSASQFLLECSGKLDLFTYLQLFINESIPQTLYDVEQIALPETFCKNRKTINNVKLYEGLERLFPERQFYTASMYQVQNLWENFYPNSIMTLLKENAIIMSTPFIMAFYDEGTKQIITGFLIKDTKNKHNY